MPIKLDYLRSGFDNHVLDWANFHRQRLATSDAVLRQTTEGRKGGGFPPLAILGSADAPQAPFETLKRQVLNRAELKRASLGFRTHARATGRLRRHPGIISISTAVAGIEFASASFAVILLSTRISRDDRFDGSLIVPRRCFRRKKR